MLINILFIILVGIYIVRTIELIIRYLIDEGVESFIHFIILIFSCLLWLPIMLYFRSDRSKTQ